MKKITYLVFMAFLGAGVGAALVESLQAAVTNADYAGTPPYIASTVTPNILFIVDLSDATIPAAYGSYPISRKTGTATAGTLAANVNVAGGGGLGLVSSSDNGVTANTATPAAPSDTFDSTKTYFGLFDPLRCYTTNSNSYIYASVKASVSAACSTDYWDGNFLNWLAMRKKDVSYQVLVGGTSKPAQSNIDGSSDKLASENTTGENGTTNTCNNNSNPCWRYVKYVPAPTLTGRVPTTGAKALPADAAGAAAVPAGRFLGSGEGTLYVNTDGSADPFDTAPANKYPLQVDLTTEPNVPAGTGSASGTCTVGDAAFAGHLVCYKRDRSLGLFQKLRTDNMRVGVMFANAGSGKAGQVVFPFDGTFNASAITQIRNAHIQTHAPLAESLYEGLCLYRNSQGPCYTNNPADFSASPEAQGDPFFFVSQNQMVPCCKSFVLMISPGVPEADDNVPDGPGGMPFGNLFTGAQVGTSTTRLDDVAFYGQTHDIRDQTTSPGKLTGTQKVTFYAVNAMGGAAGAGVLSSAAKFGGFDDKNGNGTPDATGQTCTFPAGSTLGSGVGTSSAEWDLDKDCTPDTYFDASEGGDLENQINKAIADILKKAASGTSVSVLATSSTGEGAIYQAFFFPSTFTTVGASTIEVKWTGFTQGLFIDTFGNLREDYSADGCQGAPDGKLVLKHDCIIKVRYDTATNDVKVDRFKDDNGDGVADSATPFQTVSLKEVQPMWEGGRRLALTDPGSSCAANSGGVSCRRILTWLDVNNGGEVGSGSNTYGTFESGAANTEFGEFSAATTTKVAMLCPYLGGALAADCNSAVAADKTAALNEATGLINFIRGCDEQDTGLAYCTHLTGLRSRLVTTTDDTGAAVIKTWKLGDIIDSTPVVVGPPRERYDVLYGDAGYISFFQRYKDRRQVAYVGANDGMLHAFNAGFFTLGDDTSTTVVEQARFTTVPVQPGTSTTCAALPCDASVTPYAYRSNNPKLGAELWAFIPQDLLPHLRWLTSPSYDHTYYVDLKPKVTDARIFTADADHPGGWGTILIGGFRMGGSCTNCTQGKSTPRVVTADFNGDGNTTSAGDTRVFLSSYFVMDVTNPEKDPVLLWVFRDKDLGLTTSEPAVLRVKPVNTASDPKTNGANEKWYVVFGTGPTHLDGASSQTAKFFAVDLKHGPQYSTVNQTTGTVGGTTCSAASPCIAADTANVSNQVRVFSTGQAGAFMGDMATVDFDLDFRVEAIYAGAAICTGATPSPCNGSGPQWRGALYRLTTNGGDPNPNTWGLSSAPTKLISTFAYTTPRATTCTSASPCKVGPILAAPTLSSDDNHNLWVFFGAGRFLNSGDKTNSDIQHYFGIKDCIPTGGCSDQTVERNNLQNVSGVTVCTSCAADANVSTNGGATYTSGFNTGGGSLVDNVLNADGWFTTLPSTRERNLSIATVIGGTVFFTTFVPTSDICGASGDGYLYALYYLTGSAYTQSAIGETAVGSNTVANRSIALGAGLPSQMAIQLGAEGSGASGTVSSAGCTSGMTGFIQTSTGALGQLCGSTTEPAWSRLVAWRDL